MYISISLDRSARFIRAIYRRNEYYYYELLYLKKKIVRIIRKWIEYGWKELGEVVLVKGMMIMMWYHVSRVASCVLSSFSIFYFN